MTVRVLVTARSFGNAAGRHHEYLRDNGCELDYRAAAHPMSADELGEIIGDYEGVILGLDTCDATVLQRAEKLRVISRFGSGLDQIDLDAAAQRGIAVTNTPGANRIGVAELTIGLMFALARNLPQVVMTARYGEWKRSVGFELYGKTLGIIGLGMIGREVAVRTQALGMTVLGYDPFITSNVTGVKQVDLPTLLLGSDIVTLHCAVTPDTENLINAIRLMQIRDGAYLINTARGALVDEDALLVALQNGKLAGAAVDALRRDPPTDSPLLALENFMYVPHLGATTREFVERVSLMAAQNLVAVLRGEPCPNIVNAVESRQRQARRRLGYQDVPQHHDQGPGGHGDRELHDCPRLWRRGRGDRLAGRDVSQHRLGEAGRLFLPACHRARPPPQRGSPRSRRDRARDRADAMVGRRHGGAAGLDRRSRR